MGQLDNSGANVQVTFSNLETHDMNVGDYVLLVNDTMQEDGLPLMTIDAETPIPIYSGRNKRGIVIKSIDSDDTITLKDSAGNAFSGLSPSSQSLIILGPQQGAGANVANGQVYPKGVTIYGRWTTFTPSASATGGGGVIAYFGY